MPDDTTWPYRIRFFSFRLVHAATDHLSEERYLRTACGQYGRAIDGDHELPVDTAVTCTPCRRAPGCGR